MLIEVKGRGGAIYVKISKNSKFIEIEKTSFGTEEGKKKSAEENGGEDLFVVADNLEKVMTVKNFPILKDMPSDYDGSMGMNTEDTDVTDITKVVKDSAKGNNTTMIIIVVVVIFVVLLVIAIVIVICFVKKKKNGNGKKDIEMIRTDDIFDNKVK